MAVILANKVTETDGSAYNLIAQVKSPIPIVLVSRPHKYEFNDALLGVKDYVLADFCEYGHDFAFPETHLFGFNTDLFKRSFEGDEWEKFDDFVRNNPPKLYFKREIFKDAVGDMAIPIEYPAMYSPPPIQSKQEFGERVLECFFSWGYSSERRRQLHGEIWKRAKDFGYMVCDNLYYLSAFIKNEGNPKKWMTACISHYVRHPMNEILAVNGMAKVSVSLPGAGNKCFRNAESPLNSVMALPKDNVVYSYPWDESNSIPLEQGKEIETIIEALRDENLYERYVAGVENAAKYLLPDYIKNHIEKHINEL